jgi:hypothetical protein
VKCSVVEERQWPWRSGFDVWLMGVRCLFLDDSLFLV